MRGEREGKGGSTVSPSIAAAMRCLVLLALPLALAQNVVQIEVAGSASCWYTREFIKNQLIPMWKRLKDTNRIRVNLLQMSESDEDVLLACASHYGGMTLLEPYLCSHLKRVNNALAQCYDNDWSERLKVCQKSKHGDDILRRHSDRAWALNYPDDDEGWVNYPVVNINGEYFDGRKRRNQILPAVCAKFDSAVAGCPPPPPPPPPHQRLPAPAQPPHPAARILPAPVAADTRTNNNSTL